MNKKTFFIVIGLLIVASGVMIGLLIHRDSEPLSSAFKNFNATTVENKTTSQYTFPGVLADDQIKNKQARISTDKGDIVIELYGDDAPLAVSNFVYLTGEGFYDGLTFHRVEVTSEDSENIEIIQGGDPAGNGTGGPGYTFEDETVTKEYTEGVVAMANAGEDTNGSQFFINTGDNSAKLAKSYTIFGKVISGMDVVKSIVVGDKMNTVTIEPRS